MIKSFTIIKNYYNYNYYEWPRYSFIVLCTMISSDWIDIAIEDLIYRLGSLPLTDVNISMDFYNVLISTAYLHTIVLNWLINVTLIDNTQFVEDYFISKNILCNINMFIFQEVYQ